jgi:hypothetical protein
MMEDVQPSAREEQTRRLAKDRLVEALEGQGELPLPCATAKILKFASKIAGAPPDRPDFLHTVLCQVGLPRRATSERKFERTNGKASLLIEAGSLWNGSEWVDQPLPSGTRPRLALVHISSEAVLNQSPIIDVGNSLHGFMMRLGIGTNGREYKNFRQQMRALSACRMTLGYGSNTIDAKPIERFSTWSDAETDAEFNPGVIELTGKFYESLRDQAVPLDPRALGALQNSALALDLYTWLSHRLHRVSRITGDRVTWKNLREQFGQEYTAAKSFKRNVIAGLRAVRAVYPDARIEEVNGGFILLPSKPPIPKTVVQAMAIVGSGAS